MKMRMHVPWKGGIICNKMKKKKYHSVGTIPESNIKIVERSKMDTADRQSLTFLWISTGTEIKSDVVKQFYIEYDIQFRPVLCIYNITYNVDQFYTYRILHTMLTSIIHIEYNIQC